MKSKISVSSLKNIGIRYEGDIYDLACMLLKLDEARNKGTNITSRNTVIGLFRIYAMLAHMDEGQVVAIAEQHKLPLGATVEPVDKK